MSSNLESHCDDHGILLDSSSTTAFTKARKRWRIAITAICFALRLARNVVPEKKKNHRFSRAQKRWRVAYAAIYSSRAMLSLVRENIRPGEKNHDCLSDLLHSPPNHTILEIEPVRPHHVTVDETIQGAHLLEIENVDDSSSPGIDQSRLTEMVEEKDLIKLSRFGGVKGLIKALKTDPKDGIHGGDHDVSLRQRTFGMNTYNKPPPKGLIHFVLKAFKDTTILILLCSAAFSLGFGVKENGPQEGWYDGGTIFAVVFLVVAVSALSNLRQERRLDKLSTTINNIKVEVARDGRRQKISIFDIVVGDVVFLTIGDQIPADGLFLEGHFLLVDESSITGESEGVKVDSIQKPFLLSGSKVADGYAQILVTSVGMNTCWGKMMSSIASDSNERTPLQARLDNLTTSLGLIGLSVVILVLVVLLIRFFTGYTKNKDGTVQFIPGKTNIIDALNSAVRIVVAAYTIVGPEGLPLAITLTLAYSMKGMMADQAMVRKLSACETMGSATVICMDKTGTLTMNQMKVLKFWLGQEDMTGHDSAVIAPQVLELFHQGVGLNTSGDVYKPVSGSAIPEFSGSPTEKAILSWAVMELGMDMEKLKQSSTILHVETFNSEKKQSGVSMRKKADNTIHVHWKGAAEMVLAACSNYYQGTGNIKSIDEEGRKQFENIIQGMSASTMRCIAFAHRQVSKEEAQYIEDGKSHQKLKDHGLTLLGIVGLKDPCRLGAKRAVQICESAGVAVKMITGDNVLTAKAIAKECGILEPDRQFNSGEVVEGVEFRNYTHEERMQKVNRIRVMARSSPFDKLLMVQCLKQMGHVVAVTGEGTFDALALKEADIGLSMGIQSTEVAKQSSDIVILDDDFASVARVLRWGRCVYNNIQKFTQFQLTVNVAALVTNSIVAVSAGEVPLTAVQLLWVKLIMDTLGALALATEWPIDDELMHRPPVSWNEPLITNIMWRNLLAQALYQIAILLTLQFRGKTMFKVSEGVNNTLIFNTFVLCQVFNAFNSRKLEKKNVFKGLHNNRLFLGIVALMIALQIVMVEFLKKFAGTEKLNWQQWAVCTAIAALSWPLGFCVKFIPVTQKPFLSYLRG